MKDIFDAHVTAEIIQRIEKLTPTCTPQWGKMNVGQMLAHCNVTYELVFDNKHKPPGGFKRLMLKLFVKSFLVNEKPYKSNAPTAPVFLVTDERVFENEKQRLLKFLDITQKLGRSHFDGKESFSFGKLKAQEWNNMFYKHLDHHLHQFGV